MSLTNCSLAHFYNECLLVAINDEDAQSMNTFVIYKVSKQCLWATQATFITNSNPRGESNVGGGQASSHVAVDERTNIAFGTHDTDVEIRERPSSIES